MSAVKKASGFALLMPFFVFFMYLFINFIHAHTWNCSIFHLLFLTNSSFPPLWLTHNYNLKTIVERYRTCIEDEEWHHITKTTNDYKDEYQIDATSSLQLWRSIKPSQLVMVLFCFASWWKKLFCRHEITLYLSRSMILMCLTQNK